MSPIKTIIRNLTDQPLKIYWAGKGEVYIPAKGEKIVDQEIWSAGDAKQRDAVIAAAATGAFEFALLVMGKSGETAEVPYCPQFAAVSYVPPVVIASPDVPPVEEEKKPEEAPIELDDSFNIIATTDESRETLAKLGAQPASEIERETVPALEFEKKAEEEPAAAEEATEEAKPAKKTRSKK